MSIKNSVGKMSMSKFVLMILTSVFGVTNIGIGFFRMGYAAIPMFLIGGICFFIPFVIMVVELGSAYKNEKGGIYTWIQKSTNVPFAFIGIFIWYASYVIWMFGKAFSIWTPLSYGFLNSDITVSEREINLFGTTTFIMPLILGLLAVILIVIVTLLVRSGPSKFAFVSSIGGIVVIILNALLMIGGIFAFCINGFAFDEPLTMQSLFLSPNPDYQDVVSVISFAVFAVFAFAGIEAIGGVSEELENPERDLKRGLYIAATFVLVCYTLGFLFVGAITAHSNFGDKIGSLQSLFIIMGELGNKFGDLFGASELFESIFTRFAGFGMFLTYLGALIALSFAPLKQLIKGTPEEFWPKSFLKFNKHDIPVNALYVQGAIVILLIVVKTVVSVFNPAGALALYDLIITMTNVGMTLPVLFIIPAWYLFRMDDTIKKDVILIKSKGAILLAASASFIVVLVGNVFTIIDPLLAMQAAPSNEDIDLLNTFIWTVLGPVAFSIIAIILYAKSYLPRTKK